MIASLAEHAKAEGHEVVVVTGDRDSFQLVDDGKVTIMATGRGVTDTKIYDEAAVIERYGVPPKLVPDFIGLKGDTSDNIPGVPGIGEKTAAQLLQQFGSLEDVLGERRQDLRRQAQAEPHRARRAGPHQQAVGHDAPRHRSTRLQLRRGLRPAARSAVRCATACVSTICANRCDGSNASSSRRSSPVSRRSSRSSTQSAEHGGGPIGQVWRRASAQASRGRRALQASRRPGRAADAPGRRQHRRPCRLTTGRRRQPGRRRRDALRGDRRRRQCAGGRGTVDHRGRRRDRPSVRWSPIT